MVIKGSNIEGQEMIRQELAQLSSEWESMQSLSDETLKSLSDCCTAWLEFHEVYDRMKKWLTEFQAKFERENANVEDTSDARLNRCRQLLKDADSQKAWMEDLNDRYFIHRWIFSNRNEHNPSIFPTADNTIIIYQNF